MKNLMVSNGKKIIFSFIFIFLLASAAFAENSIIKIGVLANRGPERCLEKWSLTADYLTTRIPGKIFKILPIEYNQIYSVVEKAQVDFILANPSFYVELESQYGISRIATLKNKVLGKVYTKYGGVIFCKKQRQDIRDYNDLKGKTFMAVDETSFGGWRMAWRELKAAGIDPYKDFSTLSFGGTQDAVIYAIQEGKVDVGTVQTDALELMDVEGKIRLEDFYVIHIHGGGMVHLPFVHSTRSYAEWPMAMLAHISYDLAEKVADALINMPEDSAAAQAAICGGWTIPLNYQSVHDCLKELKLGPYKDFGKITLTDVLKKYWILIAINFAVLVVLAWLLTLRTRFNQKITAGHKALEKEIGERIQAERTLRESQEKYRLLVNNASDGIFIAQDNIIKFPNRKTQELTGYSADELSKISFINIIHPDDRELVMERHKGRLRGEKFASIYSFKIIHKSGSIHTVQLSTVQIQWEGRAATLNFIRDITQQVELEARLQQSRKMESIGTLAGGIAHDFNNILYPIMGFAEMSIEDLPDNHPVRENLEDILQGAKRARGLVKQILLFSTQKESEQKPLMLKPLIKETLKLLRSTIPANIEILQDFYDDPDCILGDITEIQEVILNLCTNAYHAMEKTGGTLKIGLKKAEPGPDLNLPSGDYCCLSISDTGMGIPPDIINKIFDPYFTTKEQGKGSGMGLSVIHGIVKNCMGAITVESTPGKGSVFKVFFPITSEAKKSGKEIKNQQIQGGDETILFVDDETAIVKLGVRLLERFGYKVTGKTNSQEALALFESAPARFDLVISDMAMPGMVGTEFAKKLMEIRQDISVIICTGFSERLDHETATALGIKGYIRKPILLDELTSKVREVLNQSKKG